MQKKVLRLSGKVFRNPLEFDFKTIYFLIFLPKSKQVANDGFLCWLLMLVPYAGSLSWRPMMAPYAGSLCWLLMLAPYAGSLCWLPMLAPNASSLCWLLMPATYSGSLCWPQSRLPVMAPYASYLCWLLMPATYAGSLCQLPILVPYAAPKQAPSDSSPCCLSLKVFLKFSHDYLKLRWCPISKDIVTF